MLVSVLGAFLLTLLLSATSHSAPVTESPIPGSLGEELTNLQDGTNVRRNMEFLQHLSNLANKKDGSVLAAVEKFLDDKSTTSAFPEVWKNNRDSNNKFEVFEERVNNQNSMDRNLETEKRKLKFNPTGWRRKRSADDQGENNAILARINDMVERSRIEKINMYPGFVPSKLENKRSFRRRHTDFDDIIAHIRTILAKRRAGPLDFNPTGW